MTNRMGKLTFVCVLALAIGLVGARSQARAQDAGARETVTMDGSTTVGPIAKAFAEYYMKQNPGVEVTVNESGSGNGAKSLMAGTCDIANMSRFMKDREFVASVQGGVFPVAHVVALDGIAAVVHPANPVKNLTIAQVRDIYAGKIKSWKDVGGPNEPIIAISRDNSSGTYESFYNLVMGTDARIAENVEAVGSNGQMRARVQATRGALGYVGLGFVDKTVKALTVNGVAPSRATVAAGRYPIARPLYMFTNAYPKLGSHTHALVTLYLSPKGQAIIESLGFVPLTDYR